MVKICLETVCSTLLNNVNKTELIFRAKMVKKLKFPYKLLKFQFKCPRVNQNW